MFRLPGELAVVAVGKMRTKHWLAAQNEYLKRMQRYGQVNLTEVKDAVGRGMTDAAAMQREGELLLKASAGNYHRILLTPTGKMMSSPGLSKFLHKYAVEHGRLAFLIGGPLGFSPDVIAAADAEISLSPLTFTHEMARVMLLEQLYRACTLLNGEKYHK